MTTRADGGVGAALHTGDADVAGRLIASEFAKLLSKVVRAAHARPDGTLDASRQELLKRFA